MKMPELIDVPLLTDEEMAQYEDLLAEGWVDPMETEEPALNEESEFLVDCD